VSVTSKTGYGQISVEDRRFPDELARRECDMVGDRRDKYVIDKAHTIVLRNSPSITLTKTWMIKHARLCSTSVEDGRVLHGFPEGLVRLGRDMVLGTDDKYVVDKAHTIVLRNSPLITLSKMR
jgi:hypothetical protein